MLVKHKSKKLSMQVIVIHFSISTHKYFNNRGKFSLTTERKYTICAVLIYANLKNIILLCNFVFYYMFLKRYINLFINS